MNHATYSLGAVSSPSWRPGGHHQAPRPPRSGSTSPRRDKKPHYTKKTHHDDSHTRPKSSDGSPGECSPVGEYHDKCHSYHYLGVGGYRSNPLTPPVLRNQRKKRSQRREELPVDDSTISKSPSAPNLHATPTTMLALKGSLAAFTAMAVRKAQTEKQKAVHSNEASGATTPHGRYPVVITSSPEDDSAHCNETGRKILPNKVDVQLQSQPQCSCKRSTMSPTTRLAMHAHVTGKNSDPMSSPHHAWQERKPDQGTEKESFTKTNKHLKHYVFKETSV